MQFCIVKHPSNRSVNTIKQNKNIENYRSSSRRRCPVRKGVLRNFAKFTGKHLRQSLFFNKGSCEFSEISKKTSLTEHLWATASGTSLNFAEIWDSYERTYYDTFADMFSIWFLNISFRLVSIFSTSSELPLYICMGPIFTRRGVFRTLSNI